MKFQYLVSQLQSFKTWLNTCQVLACMRANQLFHNEDLFAKGQYISNLVNCDPKYHNTISGSHSVYYKRLQLV